MASRSLRPRAWLPVLDLLVLGAVALAVEPWPEGPILLKLRGFGAHGVTLSDVLVSAVVLVVSAGWFWSATSGELIPSRPRRAPDGG